MALDLIIMLNGNLSFFSFCLGITIMITHDYCVLMSRYNEWQNNKLYAICGSLSDEQRRRDNAAYFGSIHGTLNHLMYADLAFLSRFTGDPEDEPAIGIDLYGSFGALKNARQLLDQRMLRWAASLTDEWLDQTLTYTSQVDGMTRTKKHWQLVTHLFNHQTHHRGQLTTLLSQAKIDYGSTDLPFMPD